MTGYTLLTHCNFVKNKAHLLCFARPLPSSSSMSVMVASPPICTNSGVKLTAVTSTDAASDTADTKDLVTTNLPLVGAV